MPSPDVDIATGITIDFATTGFEAQILDVNGPSLSRDEVEVTHQGTTGAKRFLPVDLYDAGELTFDIHFNPDTNPQIDADPEVITITWPAGATWVFTGFITGYEPAGPLNDKMTGSITVKIDGIIAITPAA